MQMPQYGMQAPQYGKQEPQYGMKTGMEHTKCPITNISLSEWTQPFPDARGSVAGKANYGRDSAKEDATRLRKAMKGLGTDKGTIVEITGHRTFAQRRMIANEFMHIDTDKEERDLLKDLKSELSGDLEKLVLALYMEPGEFDARMMEKAMRGLGTNEDLLNEILCTRTNKEIQDMKMAWTAKIDKKRTLEEWVSDETKKLFGASYYHTLCLKLLEAKRPPCGKPDPKQVRADAESLNHLLLERSSVNNAKSKFVEVFTERSWPHIGALVGEFQQMSKKWTLEAAICHAFGDSSDTAKALRVISEFCAQPYDFWAKKIRDSMKGVGTDEYKLIRLIVSRCEVDMLNIAQVFGQRYGNEKTLKSWIESDTSSYFCQLLLNLCGYH